MLSAKRLFVNSSESLSQHRKRFGRIFAVKHGLKVSVAIPTEFRDLLSSIIKAGLAEMRNLAANGEQLRDVFLVLSNKIKQASRSLVCKLLVQVNSMNIISESTCNTEIGSNRAKSFVSIINLNIIGLSINKVPKEKAEISN